MKNYGLLIISLLFSAHVTLSAGAVFSAFANVPSVLTDNRFDMVLTNAPALASGGLISAGSVNFKPGSTLNLSPGIARPSLDSSLQPLIDIPVQELVKALNFLVEEKAPEDALYGTYPEASHMPEPVRSLSVLKILHLINYHTSAP